MSQINVNRIKDSNEGAPDFPSGVNVSGITSTVTLGVTNLTATNVNVSGVVTATTFDGSMSATGTPTLGLGVTINASGLNISGVATAGIVSATTLYGDGSNLTGIALSIAPLNYNPALNSQASHLTKASGIGLTFNQGVKAGSGNVTLSLANAGVAGTVVENFGVGSSVTYSNGDTITITPTADLSVGQDYHLSYPSGAFTNIGGDVSYVGTAYTFQARNYSYQLFGVGQNSTGQLGINDTTKRSSPTQIPGTTWSYIGDGGGGFGGNGGNFVAFIKSDGTLWVWGRGETGALGLNDAVNYSSPIQIPGTTWASTGIGIYNGAAIKTDGTLWIWGTNNYGQLAQNDRTNRSSPIQIPGTTWASIKGGREGETLATKTDGTAWSWGYNHYGALGHNNLTSYSSPTQIPGTNWSTVNDCGQKRMFAIKTDGTLWSWGLNSNGELGLGGSGNPGRRSSPTQIPGTSWRSVSGGYQVTFATRTDGTLWSWGNGGDGGLGQNNQTDYSSPRQVGSDTNWSSNHVGSDANGAAIKTDGTAWVWGSSQQGELAQNSNVKYSSPVQIPGTNWNDVFALTNGFIFQTKV